MAEKIIDNPSLLPSDLAFELSGNTITAISGHPVAGSGGGTQSDFVYYPVFDDTTGNVEFHLGTTASNPQPAGGWHISGATGPQGIQGEQGIQGIQGIPGVDGKNPVFEINSSDAHWRWKYAEATSGWTDLGVVASGAVGPKGDNGTNGVTPGVRINTSTNKWEIADDGVTWVSTNINATGPQGTKGDKGDTGAQGEKGEKGDKGDNGVSPTVSTDPTTGGTIVTFTYGTGQSESITVLNGTPGAEGAEGASGYSPTITLEAATSVSYPNGGTKVTITDLEHQAGQEFYVWNGNDGQGATVNLLEGTGIKIEKVSQDYTIGVSGDYASTSVVEAASANALSEAESWVVTEGYLKAVPDSYATKTYANDASANALSEAKTWVGQRGFITKDVDDLTYYYKTSETSSTSELSTEFAKKVNNPDTSLTNKYLVLRTDTNGAASGWCDFNDKIYSKSESDGRYMQKNTDSTLSGDGTTNTPLGIDTTDMDDNKQYAFTTTGWEEVQGGGGGGETNIIESIRLEGDSADVTITNKKATIPLATASATGVAGNTGVITKDDKAHLDAAVEYKENPYDSSSPKALIPQQMFVCESDQQIIDIVTNHTDLINGKGTIFFRITGI